MNKAPAILFYVRDHLTDTEVSGCSLATRGFWWDAVCSMQLAPERGQLVAKTYEQLAIICRCTPAEARAAVAELDREGVADVTYGRTGNADVTPSASVTPALRVTPRNGECNGPVTLANRRMVREENRRAGGRERIRRHRERKRAKPRNADVTLDATPPLASAVASAGAPLPPVTGNAGGNGQAKVFADRWLFERGAMRGPGRHDVEAHFIEWLRVYGESVIADYLDDEARDRTKSLGSMTVDLDRLAKQRNGNGEVRPAYMDADGFYRDGDNAAGNTP